ncbi:hypothetical protein NDU88_000870 [Pleurodeles waltl]|uniref:Uncharacterized protein n=1 Tax=Pleurodeles waltl TaxID=8319 RepID=A0AAV7LW54_PLEWA|nr:hypothetical protein NDU88_000870 [Pleurodeles waltl]
MEAGHWGSVPDIFAGLSALLGPFLRLDLTEGQLSESKAWTRKGDLCLRANSDSQTAGHGEQSAQPLADPETIALYLVAILGLALDITDREDLEQDLTLSKVQAAIAMLCPGETPRPNGLPAELYKWYSSL